MPLLKDRGFNKLPEPEPEGQDLFFDIEGLDKILNPEEQSDDKFGLEYLFGVFNKFDKKKPYIHYWAHNQEEEKKQFENLINYFVKHLAKYPKAHIYHFLKYRLLPQF